MKKSKIIIFLILLVGIFYSYAVSCAGATSFNKCNISNKKRSNIVFIMGEDGATKNQYYTKAKTYYENNPKYQGEEKVFHCRSLEEILKHLKENNINNLPWGKIRIVVHSNEWTGMDMSVLKDGERLTTEILKQAIREKMILPLSNDVVDEQSEVIIYGCGSGKNLELSSALSKAVGGEDARRPIVRSTTHFVLYEADRVSNKTEKYMTKAWYGYFKTGYRPGDIRLANQFKKQYPNDTINWRNALERTRPGMKKKTFHHTFNIPVEWIVTYPSEADRPELKTEAQQIAWLKSQSELMDIINKTNIPLEYFRKRFKGINYTFDDGVTEPAIKFEGKTTVVCILKPIIEKKNNEIIPYEPNLEDTCFYSIVQ